ncbi:MAG: LptE family protein [Cyclobacteriaceae bacterium]|nr:LptE family protein [Cyclobacteriaceae bacterium]
MRHAIWAYRKERFTAKSNNTILKINKTRFLNALVSISSLVSLLAWCASCGIYSFTGSGTNAKTIAIQEFYNNTDLGPANLGQVFTNSLKDYMIQNTNLSVVAENGELQMEGIVTGYQVTQIAPRASGDPTQIDAAASSRLTITVRVTYVNTLDETMSFKDKSFSFYRDFPNDLNLPDIEDGLIRQIFEQIILDIFNASIANW